MNDTYGSMPEAYSDDGLWREAAEKISRPISHEAEYETGQVRVTIKSTADSGGFETLGSDVMTIMDNSKGPDVIAPWLKGICEREVGTAYHSGKVQLSFTHLPTKDYLGSKTFTVKNKTALSDAQAERFRKAQDRELGRYEKILGSIPAIMAAAANIVKENARSQRVLVDWLQAQVSQLEMTDVDEVPTGGLGSALGALAQIVSAVDSDKGESLSQAAQVVGAAESAGASPSQGQTEEQKRIYEEELWKARRAKFLVELPGGGTRVATDEELFASGIDPQTLEKMDTEPESTETEEDEDGESEGPGGEEGEVDEDEELLRKLRQLAVRKPNLVKNAAGALVRDGIVKVSMQEALGWLK